MGRWGAYGSVSGAEKTGQLSISVLFPMCKKVLKHIDSLLTLYQFRLE